MPLTANGKVDRKALPEPEAVEIRSPGVSEEPKGSTETMLAGIWREILSVEALGRNDNFFELGGDSVMAIRIVAKANDAGLALRPDQVFEHQTVAELAHAADSVAPSRSSQGELPKGRRQVSSGQSTDDHEVFGWDEEDVESITRALKRSVDHDKS
jgi:hypothetical protein